MHSLLQYSLESALCLTVLLLPYLLLFRKMTFHQWNRFYLLGAIFFSLTAPLIDIEIKTASTPEIVKLKEDIQLFEETPTDRPITKIENSPSKTNDITAYKQPKIDVSPSESAFVSWDVSDFLSLVYLLGVSIFMGMFLYRLAKLFKLITKSNKSKKQGFTAVHLAGKQVFSFFHFVFFDHNRYNKNEKQTLIGHERVHIQQWHSLDLLFLEILQVFFWFNPLYHLYKKLLQQEHEYFVDAIISKGLGQPQYAQILLSLATQRAPFVGHAFAYIPIKHRIFKLLQKPTTTMGKSKFLITLPILLVLFFAFSCSYDELGENIPDKDIKTERTSSIKVFFTNERVAIKNDVLFAEFNFDENGSIIRKPNNNGVDKLFELLGKGLPHYSLYFINTLFRPYYDHKSILPKEFYSKNIQHLAIKDPVFKEVEMLLFHDKMETFTNLDIGSLTDESEFQLTKTNKTAGQVDSYIAEKQEEFGNSKVDVQIVYGENNLPIYWKKERSYIPFLTVKIPTLDTKFTREELKKNLERQVANTPSSRGYSFKMAYNTENLLSKILYFPSAVRKGNEKEMHLFYNGSQKIHEMEMYNAEGTFLRKYRFHYNKAGYCTKKEFINREGNVEFSVRFDYDFYEN